MSVRPRTWWLASGVVLLAALWWASDHYAGNTDQRTFRDRIAQVDTAALASFTIVPGPARHHPEMHFQRRGTGWLVTSGGFHTPADRRSMDELLAALSDLRTLAVLGKFDAVKDRCALGDSTADHLLVATTAGILDLGVGASSGNEEMITAVHPENDAQIYSVAGSLGAFIDRSYIDWIPKPMVNGDPRNWRRVTFMFPGNLSYALERTGDHWTIGGTATDSVKVAHFLRNLSRYSGKLLADPADTLKATLIYNLIVEDTTRTEPVMLGIFEVGDHLIARSTLAPPNIVMPFDRRDELPRLFRPPTAFMPDDPAVNR